MYSLHWLSSTVMSSERGHFSSVDIECKDRKISNEIIPPTFVMMKNCLHKNHLVHSMTTALNDLACFAYRWWQNLTT